LPQILDPPEPEGAWSAELQEKYSQFIEAKEMIRPLMGNGICLPSKFDVLATALEQVCSALVERI